MGCTILSLKEDLVMNPPPISENFPIKLLLVDVADILDEVDLVVRQSQEQPTYDHFIAGPITDFLYDIYNEIGFLPNGQHTVARNIGDVLDVCDRYFPRGNMSQVERQAWITATEHLIRRFVAYKLYGRDNVHRYDFYDYNNGTLYLCYNEDSNGY